MDGTIMMNIYLLNWVLMAILSLCWLKRDWSALTRSALILFLYSGILAILRNCFEPGWVNHTLGNWVSASGVLLLVFLGYYVMKAPLKRAILSAGLLSLLLVPSFLILTWASTPTLRHLIFLLEEPMPLLRCLSIFFVWGIVWLYARKTETPRFHLLLVAGVILTLRGITCSYLCLYQWQNIPLRIGGTVILYGISFAVVMRYLLNQSWKRSIVSALTGLLLLPIVSAW